MFLPDKYPVCGLLIGLCLFFLSENGLCGTPFEAAQEYYESGQETEARRALKQELRLRPDNLEARFNLAVLLTHISHHDESKNLYEENLKHGWHLPTVVNLSAVHEINSERSKARDLLLAATRHFRFEAVPFYLLAEMDAADGNIKQADTYFRKALKADVLNGFAHLRYARFLSAQKRHALALKHGQRAVKLLSECAPCWREFGDIQKKAGEPDQALVAYQRSAALNPDMGLRKRIIAALEATGEDERAATMKKAITP